MGSDGEGVIAVMLNESTADPAWNASAAEFRAGHRLSGSYSEMFVKPHLRSFGEMA